jgi:hypothetical protein
MVELTRKQINKLMKGGAIQLSTANLKDFKEDVLQKLEPKTIKKMVRALKEGRGMRLKLSTREMDDVGGKLSGTNKKIVKGLKSVGKTIARPAIMGLTDAVVTGALSMSGNPQLAPFVVPMVQAGVDKGLDKAKLGFGVGKDELKRIKKQMMDHLKPHMENKKHVLPLVNKIFKQGVDIMDMDEIPIKGGKIKMKQVGKVVKKGAKEIFKATKPILKQLAQQAIEQGLPMLEEGLQQAGVDPASSAAIMQSVEKLSNRGVDKYLTSTPKEQATYDRRYAQLQQLQQNPEQAMSNYSDKMLETLGNRSSQIVQKYVPQIEQVRDIAQQMKTVPTEDLTDSIFVKTPRKGGRVGMVRHIYSSDDSIIPVVGGRLETHMGTLLEYDHPAMKPTKIYYNQHGGSFRGYGSSSFRGYGTPYDRIRRKYGGSFM